MIFLKGVSKIEHWSKGKIISEIRGLHEEGKYLNFTEVIKENSRLVSACNRYFGTWAKAVKAAGLNPLTIKKKPRKRPEDSQTKREFINKFQRVLGLVYYINNCEGTTTNFLAEKLDVSTKTIQRYIEDLRAVPGLDIIYVDNKTGYIIKHTEGKIFLKEEDDQG